VSGESYKAHFALLFGGEQRFGCSSGGKNQIRVVVVHHFVDLPQIDVIGLEAAQGFFQLASWPHLCRGHGCKL